MEKEYLIQLKKKIAEYSDEEKRLRDLYLADLSSGKILGPLTGYPTIDRPQVKNYNQEKILENLVMPKRTIYQEIVNNNKNHLKDVAIEFFGTKITYEQLLKKIDETAKALVASGVKSGDFVTICSAGVPEIVYTFYALSKIGAVGNFMSPFFDKKAMSERINDCKSTIIIVMDKFIDGIRDTIKKTNINQTIIVPTLNSGLLGLLDKKGKLEDGEVYWNQFVSRGKKIKDTQTKQYESRYPLCLVYSSGTTGASKAILLSNDSFQESIHGYPITGLNVTRNQKFYQMIPLWYSTGLSTSIHLPLSYGSTVFMDPRFDRKVFVDNIIKHKINATIASTSLYEGFQDPKITKNRKIYNLTNAFQGGEKLDENKRNEIHDVWKKGGCNSTLKIGFGQCECGAGITTQTDQIHTQDTVGIPLYGVSVGIFDDNNNELGYNTRGKIFVNTKCGMIEYYNNPSATSKYFYYDDAKIKWNMTGDIGYINEQGELVVLGRESDYSIVNGEKIFNFDIENIILEDPDIVNCDVLLCKHEEESNNYLIAHIVLKENMYTNEDFLQEKISAIQERILERTNNTNMLPIAIKLWNSFPIAKSGKRDTELMSNDSNGLVFKKESLALKKTISDK